jgi:hypothetical protein
MEVETFDVQVRLIKSARVTGLFCRYGFVVDSLAMKCVDQSDLSALAYLDAFCATDDQGCGEFDLEVAP